MTETFSIKPIGYLHSEQKYRFEAPRQSTLAVNYGKIILESGQNFEQALEELDGFDRIWIIYSFHLNKNWKPKIKPPRSEKKVGVFASRSPHRPNQIGMSCVELEKIEGRTLFIKNFDLLDKTPILDIKPYIPYCDSFPESKTGWLPEKTDSFEQSTTKLFIEQANWIKEKTDFDLVVFAKVQLEEDPTNQTRKRVTQYDDDVFCLAYRTWRIFFEITENCVVLKNVKSGYSFNDLATEVDKYNDKQIHRDFIKLFEDKNEG